LKLLLDEMYPYSIAEQLRARGHDVVAVGERSPLRGASDQEVFGVALQEARALVTADIGFRKVDADHRARGHSHHGIVFTSNKRFPRGSAGTTGRIVRALDRFLREDSGGLALNSSFTYWLR
jgi:hypothetical protein